MPDMWLSILFESFAPQKESRDEVLLSRVFQVTVIDLTKWNTD